MAKILKPSKPSKTPSADSAELGRLEKIFEMMTRHGMAELEWERGNDRLRLRTQGAVQAQSLAAAHSHAVHHAPIATHSVPVPAAPVATPAKAVEIPKAPSNQKQVVSPFVGTFYRSASPTADPYVREGQSIKRGDVLCIIEAMKLMNEIEAEFAGKIISVLAENGQPVEFGEPLYVIET